MVSASPEQLREDTIALFRASEVPEAYAWLHDLSPLHQRLCIVELADAIKDAALTGDLAPLVAMVEGWQATSEIDASPEFAEELARPKEYRKLADFSR